MSLMAKMQKTAAKSVKARQFALSSDKCVVNNSLTVKTSVYAINLALSGDIHGGFSEGVTVFAGASKHFKCVDGDTPIAVYIEGLATSTTMTYRELYSRINDANEEYFVQTPSGLTRVLAAVKKTSNTYTLEFSDSTKMIVGDRHAFMDMNDQALVAEDIKIGDEIKTIEGSVTVTAKHSFKLNQEVYDIGVTAPHWYTNSHNGIIHHNTNYCLLAAAAFQAQFPEGIVLFYDSENGAKPAYFESLGIDLERMLHIPIETIEDMKQDVAIKLDSIEDPVNGKPAEQVMIVIDSVGNLASLKEVEDAANEKTVADMTRAKQLKSFFRIITPKANRKMVPVFCVGHTYSEQGTFPKDVLSGGCVDGDTLIQTQNGLVKMKEVLVGDYVLTHNDQWKPITHVWTPDTLDEGTPECYDVTFADGSVVRCSYKHKFLKDGVWTKVEDLKEGDDVE